MLGLWMVYTLLVTTLLAWAGWVADKALRARNRPTRWAWALAIPASALIPIVMFWLSAQPETGVALPELALPPLPSLDGVSSANTPDFGFGLNLTRVLAGAWLVASTLLTAGLLLSWRRLQSALGTCRTEQVSGCRILISEDLGPAVAFGFRRRIVVPRWLMEERADSIQAVVAHERSHLEARDPELILLASIPALLMPWNLALWWQLARLRLAVEVDCDQRVLARTNLSKIEYGHLLLHVGSRGRTRRFAAAAFSERPSDLRRRLERMMEKPTSRSRSGWRMLGMGFLAGVLGSTVFLLPRPEGLRVPWSELLPKLSNESTPPAVDKGPAQPERMEVVELPATDPSERPPFVEFPIDISTDLEDLLPPEIEPDISASPVFTPMTVRPEIKNISEVIQAMESEYPPLLRTAGIGGRVVVWLFVTDDGRVATTRLAQSSGHAALDDAALRVASVYRFTPAMMRDERVDVWIQFPITFEAR
jgi:TonB family protein